MSVEFQLHVTKRVKGDQINTVSTLNKDTTTTTTSTSTTAITTTSSTLIGFRQCCFQLKDLYLTQYT